jgi:hypothetical protein
LKSRKILRSFFWGGLCFVLISGASPGNPGVPQSQAGRRDVRDPRISRGAAPSLRSRTAFRRAAPALQTWAYAIQGAKKDEARGVFSAADGGAIFWGETRILGGPSQAWMTKLSSQGLVEWSRVYAVGDLTVLREVTKTADGGFVAAGYASGSTSADAIILKIATSGLVEWGALFGSEMGDAADSVQQTADGGYIVAGVTNANYDSSVTDYWISKLTAVGDVEWSSVLGGPGIEGDFATDLANATVRQSNDGGYFLVGTTNSFGAGNGDIWIVKLGPNGAILWQKTFGGPSLEELANGGPHFVTTADGGLVVAGTTQSFGSSGRDGWLFKVAPNGDILWQKRISGPQTEALHTIQATSDGGYLTGGMTTSFASDGFKHAWVLRFDISASIQWQWSYGVGAQYIIQGIDQGSDGSSAAAGYQTPNTLSSDYCDAFVMKLGPDGRVGAPGSEFVGQSNTTVSNTDAASQETSVSARPGFETRVPLFVGFVDVSPQTILLSWSGLQPPLYLTVTRETNLGLFKGEALNTLQWNPNPWNSRFEVVSYAIYRQPIDGSAPFLRIATVSVNTMAYVDQGLDFNDMYAYVIRSVDSAGNESPISQVAKN